MLERILWKLQGQIKKIQEAGLYNWNQDPLSFLQLSPLHVVGMFYSADRSSMCYRKMPLHKSPIFLSSQFSNPRGKNFCLTTSTYNSGVVCGCCEAGLWVQKTRLAWLDESMCGEEDLVPEERQEGEEKHAWQWKTAFATVLYTTHHKPFIWGWKAVGP